jgi:hypothetical protein
MKFPKGVVVEKVFITETGDLTSNAKRAIGELVDKDILITIRAQIKFAGSRVLTVQATDAYDRVDTIGIRMTDVVSLEFPNE